MSQLAKLGSFASRAVQHVNKVAGNDAFEMLAKLKSARLGPADQAALNSLQQGLDDVTMQVGRSMISAQKASPTSVGAARQAEQMVNQRIKDLGGQIAALKGKIEGVAVAARPTAAAAAAPKVAAQRPATAILTTVAEKEAAFESQMRTFAKSAPDGLAGIKQVTAHAARLRAEMGLPPK